MSRKPNPNKKDIPEFNEDDLEGQFEDMDVRRILDETYTDLSGTML
tara:strand:- start:267 stop:404 length:138 start_codon:yes stop_codon:yes gene_type:complete